MNKNITYGIYHISWEIKDLQGKFFDIAKRRGSDDPDYNKEIGLYVESDGQATFNLGLPEYGEGLTDYLPIWSLNNNPSRTPPRPLKPYINLHFNCSERYESSLSNSRWLERF